MVPLRVLVMLDRIFTSTLSAGILQATRRATCRIKGCFRNCQTRWAIFVSGSRFPSRGSRQTDVDFSQRSSTNRLTKSRLQESDRQSKVKSEDLPAKVPCESTPLYMSFFFGGRFLRLRGLQELPSTRVVRPVQPKPRDPESRVLFKNG